MNILFFLKPKIEVAVVYEDYTLRQVLETMEHHRYASIPILGKNGKYAGSITEGDLLWHIKSYSNLSVRDAEKTLLSEVKRKHTYSAVRVDAAIEDLIEKATTQNFIPVIDDTENFIGIVTRGDIMNYCFSKLKGQPK